MTMILIQTDHNKHDHKQPIYFLLFCLSSCMSFTGYRQR